MKQIEPQYKRPEEKFPFVLETTLIAMVLVNQEGQIVLVNSQTEKIFGYSREELLGEPVEILVPDRLRRKHAELRFGYHSEPLTKPMGVGRDLFGLRKDGREFHVEIGLTPVESTDGLHVLCTLVDLAERNRVEEALRESEERYRAMEYETLVNAIDGIVWEADARTFQFTFVSKQAERLLGYPVEHWFNEPTFWQDHIHPDDREWAVAFCVKATKEKRDHEFEYRMIAADGRTVWLRDLVTVVVENDQPVRLRGVMVDITKRKQAEEKLKTYAAELERSNRELADFASVASHDLQEPLRKIQAFGKRLKNISGAVMNDEEHDYLERMQKAADRMRALIDDLMTYSRVTATAQSFVSVDLAEVARQVLTDLEVSIEQKDAHVEVGHLPKIEAVPLQMRQMLQNLIGNALKFHRKKEAPVVKVYGELLNGRKGHRARSNLCQIIVQDHGIGFDEKYLDRIFTLFQRLHGGDRYEGTGMGLAICRKICEHHNGSITTKSKPGQGATFIVTLPVKQSRASKVQ